MCWLETKYAALELLAMRSWEQHFLLVLFAIQLLIATLVAITMTGWWFPGRTMLTVLPLLIVPLALMIGGLSTAMRLVTAPFQSHREEQSDVAIPSMQQGFPV